MTTSSTLNQPIHDGKVYSCRHNHCNATFELSSEVRVHWLFEHTPVPHEENQDGQCVAGRNCRDCNPMDAQQFANTSRGLANHMNQWYADQPGGKHVCEFEHCSYRSTVMTTAGVVNHYVFKHSDSPRAVSAFYYAVDHGLEEVMDRTIRRNRGMVGVSEPTPF